MQKASNKSRSFVFIRGKRWYYRLIPNNHNIKEQNSKSRYFRCLTDEYPIETLENKLVIGFESLRDDGKSSRTFAVFDSYIELFHYQKNIPIPNRNFYEIIIGEFAQKPHFDVDIKKKEISTEENIIELAEKVKDSLINTIFLVCDENSIKLDIAKDILIYQSHSDDYEKCSFHIVVHHYCHTNNHQALAFYKKIVELMPDKYSKYIDHSVYSSKQNFRLLGNQKIGSGRPKMFQNRMRYQGKYIKHIYDVDFKNEIDLEKKLNLEKLECLKESLVSWVNDCEYLPSFQREEERTKKQNYEDLGDLSPETVKEAEKFIGNKDFPFIVRDIKGSVISLRRLRPSFCDICDRIHENENPYMLVVENNVYFCCRRNKNKKKLLGEITTNTFLVDNFLKDISEESEDGYCLEMGGYKPDQLLNQTKIIQETKDNDILEVLEGKVSGRKTPKLNALEKINKSKWVTQKNKKVDHIKNTKDFMKSIGKNEQIRIGPETKEVSRRPAPFGGMTIDIEILSGK